MLIYVGQTFLAQVSDLTDPWGEALLTPTVTIDVVKPDGTLDTGTVSNEGAVFWSEFDASSQGVHVIRATATSGGGTWKSESTLYVHPV